MSESTAPLNMLTFDIEEWFHANYQGVDLGRRSQASNFRANMDRLLHLCDQNKCQATFFVLGVIAETYPDVIRQVHQAGHEVASHGYAHELAYRQSLAEFRQDVAKSLHILQSLLGEKICGYRAPSWSIIRENYHYLAVLEEQGLLYDASIFPVKTFLYGIPDSPLDIHRPRIGDRPLNLWEVPMSVMRIGGKNMGFSGGFYFRALPFWLIRRLMSARNAAGQQTIVYLHPRELDPQENRLQLPALESFIQYYNVAGTEKKLDRILQSFRFASIGQVLQGRRMDE